MFFSYILRRNAANHRRAWHEEERWYTTFTSRPASWPTVTLQRIKYEFLFYALFGNTLYQWISNIFNVDFPLNYTQNYLECTELHDFSLETRVLNRVQHKNSYLIRYRCEKLVHASSPLDLRAVLIKHAGSLSGALDEIFGGSLQELEATNAQL